MKLLRAALLVGALTMTSCSENLFDHDPNLSLEANLQNLADAHVSDGAPGLVLIVDHPDKGYHVIRSGHADIDQRQPIRSDMLFHGASLAKVYTATSILLLEERGLLSLDDPISDHLEAGLISRIPNGSSATVRSLLDHTSGIPDFAAQQVYIDDLLAHADGGAEPNDEVTYIEGLEPDFAVGDKTRYNNSGYYLLSHVVERIAGQPYEVFLRENVLGPAGLADTFYKNLPAPVDYTNVPKYYVDFEANGTLVDSNELEDTVTKTFEGYSGMLATPEDYFKFLKALFSDKTILSSASLSKMMEAGDSEGLHFGLGLEIMKSSKYPDRFGHRGGSQASFFYHPDEDSFVLAFANIVFLDNNGPVDRKLVVPDEVGQNGNLVGEIEKCLFD